MKRLLSFSLITAVILPITAIANTLPKNDFEFVLWGSGGGNAVLLCELISSREISLTDGLRWRNSLIPPSKNSRNNKILQFGFNEGLATFDSKKENYYRKCAKLKFKNVD
tara:strand:+ start:295 stop:624 length:330 start_codon:yes stop_codon:yes gene_type:complete